MGLFSTGMFDRNSNLKMSARGGECKIAFVMPQNGEKIYYALLINDEIYRVWDVDTFSNEAIEFVEVLMEAYDKGYTLRTQCPSKIDNERKMVPISMTIRPEMLNRNSEYASAHFGVPEATEAPVAASMPAPVPAPATPTMPEIKAKPEDVQALYPNLFNTPAAENTPAASGTTSFPSFPGIKPLSPLSIGTPQPSEAPQAPAVANVPSPEPTPVPVPVPAPTPAVQPAMKVIEEPRRPYGVCLNGHVTYRKIAFCPECGKKITEQAYSNIPMIEEEQESNEDVANLMASYMNNFNKQS